MSGRGEARPFLDKVRAEISVMKAVDQKNNGEDFSVVIRDSIRRIDALVEEQILKITDSVSGIHIITR